MGVLDDIIVNAKSAMTKVSKKAEQVIDTSKLKYAENGINKEISEKLEDLGLFVYESTVEGEMDKAALQRKITELNDLYKQLDSTKEMIAACKNKKVCGTCGSFNDKDASFCNKCGTRLSFNTEEFDKIVVEDEEKKESDDSDKVVTFEEIKSHSAQKEETDEEQAEVQREADAEVNAESKADGSEEE
ncbi:MAG: hypothetical protein ACI4I4_06585 [Acutalibacteraceae bacterium]